MLAGLRLDGFVGRDHKQDHVNAAHTGEHIADKTFMAWNINEAIAELLTAGRVEFQVGKTQVNGNAATLFLFQTVGINAGQRFHQRGLTVIDVSSRANDDGFHWEIV